MKGYKIGLFLIFFSQFAKAGALNKEQIKTLESTINAFMGQLRQYCICKGEKWGPKKADVIKYKDDRDATDYFFNDLVAIDNGSLSETYNWDQYLNNIHTDYHNDIDFTYNNLSVLDCINNYAGVNYGYVSVDKEVTYQKQKQKYTLLIAVNLNTYLIKEIVSLKFNKNHDNVCTNEAVDNTNISDQLKNERILADNYFSKGQYINAKNLYNAIKEKIPFDPSLESRIEECERYISYPILKARADGLYNLKKYDDARNIYSKLLNYPQANNAEINKKIIDCNREINELIYQENMQTGNAYYDVANFEQARNFYTKALSAKPGDYSAISKLEQSRNGDITYAQKQISDAIISINKSKKNVGKGFRTLAEYEPSRLLSIKSYVFLIMKMLKNDDRVRKEMNYTKADCRDYLHIYSAKLRIKANKEVNPEDKAYALHILDDVLTPSNQK